MIKIGILGGVASGKSQVSKFLAEFGARVLDADAAGHEVLAEPKIVAKIVQEFGSEVLDDSGKQIDRAKLGELVFANGSETKRRRLEAITHPAIRNLLESQAAAIARSDPPPALVFDVPLLLEVGWQEMCEVLIFVDTPEVKRQEFAAARGWDEAELARRQQTQMDLEQKRLHADQVIPNTGSLENLRQAVRNFWDTHVVPRVA